MHSGINLENISVPGLTAQEKMLNPNGSSLVLASDSFVFIIRPYDSEELQKRQWATELHEGILPQYTQHTVFMKLQGIHKTEIGEESLSLFARVAPLVENTVPITEIPILEIVKNRELCQDLEIIFREHLKLLLEEELAFDFGQGDGYNTSLRGKKLPNLIKAILSLGRDNILVGKTWKPEIGREDTIVFVDPDWANTVEEISEMSGKSERVIRMKLYFFLKTNHFLFKTINRIRPILDFGSKEEVSAIPQPILDAIKNEIS